MEANLLPIGIAASIGYEPSDVSDEVIAKMPEYQQYLAEVFNTVNQYDEAAVVVGGTLLSLDGARRMTNAAQVDKDDRGMLEFYRELLDGGNDEW